MFSDLMKGTKRVLTRLTMAFPKWMSQKKYPMSNVIIAPNLLKLQSSCNTMKR